MKKLVTLMMVGTLVLLWTGSPVLGAADGDTETQLQALQTRVAQLEAQLNKQGSNAELLKGMVAQMDSAPAQMAADSALTAGYDKRFFIKSADDQFKLEFDTRLQFRHTYGLSDDGSNDMMQDGTRPPFGASGVDSSASAFELERVKLYLRGHVLKDINYNICFEADDDADDSDSALYTYEVSYNFMPEMGVRLGRYKGPFGKQEPTSSGRQMLVDRSLANEVFNIDRTTGVELFGTLDMGDIKPNYRIMLFNGLQNNDDTPFSGNDNSPGIAARLAVPMMGATAKDFANESDLKGHDNLVSQVGFSFAYSNDRNEDHFAGGESDSYEFLGKNPDGRSDVYELGGETTLLGIDFAMKSNGLSVILEGFYQHVDADAGELAFENDFGTGRNVADPITGAIIDGCELDNYGWYAQAGYFVVPEKFELVSRVSGVHVDSTNDMYEYAAGWNYYISGQDLKLSMDLSYIDDLPITSSSANFDGVQNNSLFMVRTQLQFQF